MGVYMASLVRLALLEAWPFAATVPPPSEFGSFGEDDGKESLRLFFKVLILVMVFSIMLVSCRKYF